MIYFSAYDTVKAEISFLILGIFFGGFYNCISYFYFLLKQFVKLPQKSYSKYKKHPILPYKVEQSFNNGIVAQLLDFCFVVAFGISYILFSYLFLDGTFRMFSVFFAGAGYILSLKLLGVFFSVTIGKFIVVLLKFLETALFITLFPLFWVSDIIKKLIMPIIEIISQKYAKYRFDSLIRIKKKQTEKSLQKIF